MASAAMRAAGGRIARAPASSTSATATQAAIRRADGSTAALCNAVAPVTKPRMKLRMVGAVRCCGPSRVTSAVALAHGLDHAPPNTQAKDAIVALPPNRLWVHLTGGG